VQRVGRIFQGPRDASTVQLFCFQARIYLRHAILFSVRGIGHDLFLLLPADMTTRVRKSVKKTKDQTTN